MESSADKASASAPPFEREQDQGVLSRAATVEKSLDLATLPRALPDVPSVPKELDAMDVLQAVTEEADIRRAGLSATDNGRSVVALSVAVVALAVTATAAADVRRSPWLPTMHRVLPTVHRVPTGEPLCL